MAGMDNPLPNPFRNRVDDAEDKTGAIWKAAGAGAGVLGAVVARKLLDGVRLKISRRGGVPLNPEDERMSWAYALAWAGIVGITAALGRLLAQMLVAKVWKRKRHRPVAAMPT
jgi:hypothetical protein